MIKKQKQKPSSRAGKTLLILIGLVVFGLSIYGISQLKNSPIMGWFEALNSWMFFLALLILPQIGFPVSILYPLAGIKYGFVWGLVWTISSIIGNLFLSYGIARLFGPFLRRFMERRHHPIPQIDEADQTTTCLLVALVPGPSYTLKNYLLPLAGVGFKTYFNVCLPIHSLHAVTGLFLGETVSHVHPLKITILVVYAIALGIVCRKIVRKLREKKSIELPLPA